MKKENNHLVCKNKMPDWLTIQEAIQLVHQETQSRLTESDIYRHALRGDIFLSIYFHSSIALKKFNF